MCAPTATDITIRAVEAGRQALVWRALRTGFPNVDLEDAEELGAKSPTPAPASGLRLWEAYLGESLLGSIGTNLEPGRIGEVFPPRLATASDLPVAKHLWAQVERTLRSAGMALAYAYQPKEQPAAERLLALGGFHNAGDVLFVVRPVPAGQSSQSAFRPTRRRRVAGSLTFRPVTAADLGELAELVPQTFCGSRDLAVLNGVRSADDILAGWAAAGDAGLRGWRIVSHRAVDVGCVLLADYAEQGVCEVLYMGLIPAARGAGWGRDLFDWAVQWAAAERRSMLRLAVDAHNDAAIALYAAAGCVEFDRRSIWLRVL